MIVYCYMAGELLVLVGLLVSAGMTSGARPLGSTPSALSCFDLFDRAMGDQLMLGCDLRAMPIAARHGRRPPGHIGIEFVDELILELSLGAESSHRRGGERLAGSGCQVRLRHDPAAPHGTMLHSGHHGDHGHVRVDVSRHRWLLGSVPVPGPAEGEHVLRARVDIGDIGAGNSSRSRCTGW